MSWIRKSEYGRIVLLRIAASRPFAFAVVHSATWHLLQPIALKTTSPLMPDFGVCGGSAR